jgi:hypothetical protein
MELPKPKEIQNGSDAIDVGLLMNSFIVCFHFPQSYNPTTQLRNTWAVENPRVIRSFFQNKILYQFSVFILPVGFHFTSASNLTEA